MKRFGLLLWAALLICSVAIIGVRLSGGLPLETNLLALLPQQEGDAEWVSQARSRLKEGAAEPVLLLVSHSQLDSAAEAAADLQASLRLAGLLHQAQPPGKEAPGAAAFFPYRTGLLSRQDKALLASGDAEGVAQSASALLFAPFGFADATLVSNDPYLLLPRFLAENALDVPETDVKTGLPYAEQGGEFHVILAEQLTGHAFSQTYQERFIADFAETAAQLHAQFPGLQIRKAGAVFYAAEAAASAKREISLIGGLSAAAIVLLVLAVFRSLQPIFFALTAMASGVAAGLAANLVVFGQIHLIPLVFGAGLLGITVDYAMHYCCTRFSAENSAPDTRIWAVFNGLTLGLISSVLGFVSFAFAPFPGLQQIAVFSATGLVMSYLTVLFVFPRLDRGRVMPYPPWGLRVLSWVRQRQQRGVSFRIAAPLLLAAAAVAGAGYTRLESDDSIRRLQSLPEALRVEEAILRSIAGAGEAAQFFLVRGRDTEDALQSEETLRNELDHMAEAGDLGGYTALSSLVPSKAAQQKNRALVQGFLLGEALQQYLAETGSTGAAGYSDHSTQYLTPAKLRLVEGFDWINRHSLDLEDGSRVHVITLKGVKDPSALQALAVSRPGVHFADPAAQLSQVLAQYRTRALQILGATILLITGVLSLRYGPRNGLMVIAAPFAAVVLTPLVLALSGEVFTFFNVMALVLVLVLGLDYALFCVESDEGKLHISMLANALSACSTLLAFGLLTFSQQYAVHAFGVTILTGVFLAFCFAPISRILQAPRR